MCVVQFGEPSGYLVMPCNHRSICVFRRRPSQTCWRQRSLRPALRATWGALCRVISAARDLSSSRRSSICRVSQPCPVHLSNLSMATCLTAQSAYVCCFSFQSHVFWWVMTSRTACHPTSKKVRNTPSAFGKTEDIIARVNLRTRALTPSEAGLDHSSVWNDAFHLSLFSLSQVGQSTEAAHADPLSRPAHRLQLRPAHHRAHQVSSSCPFVQINICVLCSKIFPLVVLKAADYVQGRS